ncbi:MAG: hypothetical protein Ta2F_08800 [Termitinemataceae bacterium]|nr:MAG: hypothetical protein Ta2F_08800 [Termitinemataceae bacterium]
MEKAVACSGKFDEKYLHSRFDPVKEAERYVQSLNINENIKYLILIECGLCYVIPFLRKLLPHAKIISLHLSKFYFDNAQNKADASWWTHDAIQDQSNCTQFLEKEIEDTKVSEIKIIQWRPSIQVFEHNYTALLSVVVEFVKRIDANKRTTETFIVRWQKNIKRNTFIIKKVCKKINTHWTDCIVAGAGPSLENEFNAIKNMLNTSHDGAICLIAVSSAAFAFLSRGIIPDIIVASDGGYWAKHHLNQCARFNVSQTIFAITLNAAIPAQLTNYKILPIADGSKEQDIILQKKSALPLHFPQRGTVSATAIDLALSLCTGKIFLCGLDLAEVDIKSHVRPYSLDLILEASANRLQPAYSQHFVRTLLVKDAGSNRIYASWFKNNIAKYKNRLCALGEINSVFC